MGDKTMSKSPVKIGIVLPLSGAEELFGSQGLQGVKMAAAEINAAGGVLGGRPFDLIIEDEETKLNLAVEKTEKVILEDKVIAVMGPTSSAHRDAMIEICTRHRTPLLYATDYEGGCCFRYLFCYSPIPDHYVKPLVPYLMENYGESFYIIGADYVWPIKIGEAFKEEVSERGGTIVGEEYLPFDTKDFKTNLEMIRKSGAKNVVMMLLGSDGQIFIKQFTALGLKKSTRLTVMAFNENYMVGLSGEEVEGIVTCAPFLANMDKPETKAFVDRQKKMFGPNTVVSYFAESHYGLLMFLKNAIEKAGTDDKEKIIDAMGDQSLVIGNGPVTLRTSDHHMILNMLIAEVSNGRLLMKKDIGPVAPADQCGGRKKV
jgi:branched-chain amino acid transport system substrate-binding protein/urea transport system substrate-binding protein